MAEKPIYATKCSVCGKTIVCCDYYNAKKVCDTCKKEIEKGVNYERKIND